MAWTAPMTAVAASVFTAAQFNTHVRDNLNETAPAKASAASRLIVTTGVNSVTERQVEANTVDATETTTSTSYVDLTTVGPQLAITTGARALVFISARIANNTAGGISAADFDISGATTRAASDGTAIMAESSAANDLYRIGTATLISCNAGVNTFTVKYRATVGTSTFLHRRMEIVAL